MNRLNAYKQILGIVISGSVTGNFSALGRVSVKRKEDNWKNLYILNYTAEAQYGGNMTEIEEVCRGLIIDVENCCIAAIPFPKFYNWGENSHWQTVVGNYQLKHVIEKCDGSLGISYLDMDGLLSIATRGSFNSEQAIWATDWIQRHLTPKQLGADLFRDFTLLFEIIYPENRIVVDYKGREELVLLGMIDNKFGKELSESTVNYTAAQLGISRPKAYGFTDTDSILKVLPDLSSNEEGYVAIFEDPRNSHSRLRFKFKGSQYVELHRVISGFSKKNFFEAWLKGDIESVTALVASNDELRQQAIDWESEFDFANAHLEYQVELQYQNVLAIIPGSYTRKEFADCNLQMNKEIAPLVFNRHDMKVDSKSFNKILATRVGL